MSRSLLAVSLLITAMSLPASARAQTERCEPFQAKDPAELPSAERTAQALRDSIRDGLRQALVRRAAEAGVEPRGIVAVEIEDRASGRARALTFAGPVTAELAQAVIDESAADVARWTEAARNSGERPLRAGEPEHFIIRLDPLQAAELIPGQTYTECMPILRGHQRLSRGLRELTRRWRLHDSGLIAIDVGFLLSRDGRVTYGRVVRGPLTPVQENELMEMLRRTIRFRPASVEGVPVDVWIDLPINTGGAR